MQLVAEGYELWWVSPLRPEPVKCKYIGPEWDEILGFTGRHALQIGCLDYSVVVVVPQTEIHSTFEQAQKAL